MRGDPGDSLYAVVTGRVRISASGPGGKEVFLNIMEAGDAFGEIALLDGSPRTATATAMARTELMIVQRGPFFALLRTEPQLAAHLIQLLCRRVRWTAEMMEDSALLSVPARLAKRLLSLARLHGTAHTDWNEVGDLATGARTVPRPLATNSQSTSAHVERQELDCYGPG